jgi:trehalose 6-phosphate phosphatase
LLRSECRSAVYIGDDDNDEDVFRLGEESLLTIRVGKEEGSASLFYIHTQNEVDKVLSLCMTALQKAGKVRRDKKSLRGIADGFV